MRLYEVIENEVSPDMYELVPTDEYYKTSKEFISHALKHGEKYMGKKWRLVQESNPIELKKETRYKIKMEKEKEK